MFSCTNLCRSPPIARTYYQQISSKCPSAEAHSLRICAQTQDGDDGGSKSREQPEKPAALSAFERAAAYKKSLGKSLSPPADHDSSAVEGKPSPSLTADPPGPVKDPKPSEAEGVFKSRTSNQESETTSALSAKAETRKPGGEEDNSSQAIEVEIMTRDGIIRRKVRKQGDAFSSKVKGPKRIGISSSDFMGLDFSEKKATGKGMRPAGLAAGFESPPPGSLPEVQIITRDGKLGQQSSTDSLYKPKVATWGIFERPADISRTYGGGRTIKPGEQLETEEEKQARNARTRELLAAYHKKVGLDVDPKIKAVCYQAMKEGNDLFEKGYLQAAIEQFDKVMQQMPYQSELHGLAALQTALCLDSSNRFKEAKELYEKIVTHPNVTVRKKAKQFLYGFKAMDSLKVSTATRWDSSLYSKYFNAMSDGYNNMYKPSEEELDEGRMRREALVYVGILVFPLVLLLLVLALRGR